MNGEAIFAGTRPHSLAIPDHELLRVIGSGAYGEVWLARTVVGTSRAVKIVRRDHHTSTESFEREFKGLQKFEPVSRAHEGLVDVLTLGMLPKGAGFYYVMELADSVKPRPQESGLAVPIAPRRAEDSTFYQPRTLRADLKSRGALPADEVITLGLKLTAALAHLHAAGLVHRDVKPSNILFIGGEPKLADAGLVAAMDDARSLVGTAGYIAPEGPGTPQADLYALGKVLYETVFGKDRQEFPALPADVASRPDHARLLELNEIIATACAHDPKHRYASAELLLADLRHLAEGHSVKRRRTWHQAGRLGLKAAAALAVVTVAWFMFSRFNSSTPQRSSASVLATETFATSGTKNREAFNLYLLGRKCREDDTAAGHLKAIDHFERAASLDAKFARAYAGMATSYARLDSKEHTKPSVCQPKARDFALKALALDESVREAHSALGMHKSTFEWDWEGAERFFRRAVELEPNDPWPKSDLAWVLSFTGRHEEAIRLLRETRDAHPGQVGLNMTLGKVLAQAGRLEEAEGVMRHGVEIAPNLPSPLFSLAMLRWARGDADEAMKLFDRFHILIHGTAIEGKAHAAYVQAGRGEGGLKAYARTMLDRLGHASRNAESDEWDVPMNYAWYHMIGGDLDNAYLWWHRALDERQPMALYAVMDPFFALLWRDPRFDDVLRKTGLAKYFPERMHQQPAGEKISREHPR